MSATVVNERLAALTAAGTSVWLDQIRRGMIETGELARLVEEDSLRGVTSNPAIFEKAILGSPDYDEDLAAGAREGLTAREVYRRLAVRDVQLAADVLRPASTTRRGGPDGYVSLEVAPRLAHDTEGTLEQARLYWGLVDRPNLMIKIPATAEGIPAIEQALYEGMNVNVTLLFGVAAYEEVMDAFIRAMERRLADGLAARPPLRRLVLRLARGHRGRQAARGARPRGPAGPRRARQRARRLPGVPARVRRRAVRRAARRPAARCSARCGPRPASRTRPTPRRCTSTGWSGPTRSTRCRCRRCRPRPARRGDGRDRRRGPERRPRRAARRRASTSTTSPTSCCARASTRSSCR